MPASYPTTPKVFTTKSDGPGNTILAAHINDLQAEVTAVETDLIAGLSAARGGTGRTTLTANAVLYGNGTGQVGLATIGTSGQVLGVVGGVPAFTDASGGDSEANIIAVQVFS
jgi:hypothetical protein